MDKFNFEFTESQVSSLNFVLEDFYCRYSKAYNIAKELKHDVVCENFFISLTKIGILIDLINSQYTSQLSDD